MIRFYKNLIKITLLILSFNSCDRKEAKELIAPPLVDGNLEEYIELGVTPIQLSDSVNLYVFQNQHYVWMGYSFPEGSFGTMDMHLFSEKIRDTLNLHVSAQVGEWPLNNLDLAPESPESDKWWNMNGWIANEVWPNGMDRSGDTPRYKFKNAQAREIQLGKKRFGKGKWKIRLNIRMIKGRNNEYYNILFPADSTFHEIDVN